jgi:hypothetical protein
LAARASASFTLQRNDNELTFCFKQAAGGKSVCIVLLPDQFATYGNPTDGNRLPSPGNGRG